MPRRNKNARVRKQKPYHIMAKHKQKLEVEKKVEQQLAFIQRKTDEYDRKSNERIMRLDELVKVTQETSKVPTIIILASCMAGLILIASLLGR